MRLKSGMIAILMVLLLAVIGWLVWVSVAKQSAKDNSTNSQELSEQKKTEQEESDEADEATASMQPSLYYVAVNDGGVAGEKIGCNDSLVKVDSETVTASDAVMAAFEALLSNHEREIGQSGLYNPLYQSELSFSSWAKADGKVTVDLKGQLTSGGACDDARIIQQLEQTAKTASESESVSVRVNGTPVEELLSGRS